MSNKIITHKHVTLEMQSKSAIEQKPTSDMRLKIYDMTLAWSILFYKLKRNTISHKIGKFNWTMLCTTVDKAAIFNFFIFLHYYLLVKSYDINWHDQKILWIFCKDWNNCRIQFIQFFSIVYAKIKLWLTFTKNLILAHSLVMQNNVTWGVMIETDVLVEWYNTTIVL